VNLSEVPALPRLWHLIPLEDSKESGRRKKIVVGHNVAFDRTRVTEQYFRKVIFAVLDLFLLIQYIE